jgi:hypothetical protein
VRHKCQVSLDPRAARVTPASALLPGFCELRGSQIHCLVAGGSPLGPGRESRTPQAQLATGFDKPTSSTRHIRQLPAIDRPLLEQKIGSSASATSHACSSVYSSGTSISLPSMRAWSCCLPVRGAAACGEVDLLSLGSPGWNSSQSTRATRSASIPLCCHRSVLRRSGELRGARQSAEGQTYRSPCLS